MTRRDAVGQAERARDQATDRIAAIVAQAAAPLTDVYIGWSAALDARACPARFRAQGQQGWGFPGWSPPLAAGAVARAALDHHITHHGHSDHRGDPPPAPAPLEVVRAWMRVARADPTASSVGGWVAARWEAADHAALAAVAALSARWIAGFVRIMGWPLPPDTVLLNSGTQPAPRWWPARGSGITVASGADARLGRVVGAGHHVLVVHRPITGDDDSLLERAAFEAAAGALALRVAPAEIHITAADTGERNRVGVDDDLIATGVDLIVGAVDQRAIAPAGGDELNTETTGDTGDAGDTGTTGDVAADIDASGATPSPRCRWCDWLERCPPGRTAMDATRHWRAGLPVLSSD